MIYDNQTFLFNTVDTVNLGLMQERYNYENELMTAISQGNIHKGELMMKNFSMVAFESRTPDRLREMKNYCIIMNTLSRKAAESGGVHPIYLDSISSNFARKIEEINSLTSMNDFMLEILRGYCNLVKNYSVKNYSPIIRRAIIEIQNDLTADLSLNNMAKISNVSPPYFSSLFKKETGQTLTQYVNQKRINHAKYLLENTTLQVQTVAQNCGILDFHYFCRIFKRATGKTPSQYRTDWGK